MMTTPTAAVCIEERAARPFSLSGPALYWAETARHALAELSISSFDPQEQEAISRVREILAAVGQSRREFCSR